MTNLSLPSGTRGAVHLTALAFSLAVLAGTPARAQTVRPAPDAADRTVVWSFDQVTEQATLTNASRVARMISRSYPQQLLDSGVAGSATLEVIVAPDGTVERATVVDASRREFAVVARGLARALRFRPAKVENVAVRSRFIVPVDFKVADG
ncbi:MAG TPA: energy transducer TonB [Longimicrobiaceae bacterium]